MSAVLQDPRAAPPPYKPGQVLTASDLNASLAAKVDGDNAVITAGTIQGLSFLGVSGTTPSTSPITGALVVAGGVGVGGDVNTGGYLTIAGVFTCGDKIVCSSNLNSSSPTTGAAVVKGGMGVGADVFVGGKVNAAGTLTAGAQMQANGNIPATSVATGSLVVTGGEGISGDLYVGGTVNAQNINAQNLVIKDIASSGPINGVNNPNLLNNSSGEYGIIGWTLLSAFGVFTDATSGAGSGFTNGSALATLSGSNNGPSSSIGANQPVTMSVNVLNGLTAGTLSVALAAYTTAGAFISNVFSTNISNGTPLTPYTGSGTTPAATAYVVPRITLAAASGPAGAVTWRRVRVESGLLPSLYSQEASMAYVPQLAADAAITYAIALG